LADFFLYSGMAISIRFPRRRGILHPISIGPIRVATARLFSGLAIGLMAFLSPSAQGGWSVAQEPLWSLTTADRAYLTTGYNERSLAYNSVTGNLYIVHAPSGENVTVAILDGETGAHLGELSVEGIEGGFERLRRIRVTSDGAIYAANITTNSRTLPYRLYRWPSEQDDPVLIWEGDPSGGIEDVILRYGDNLAARSWPGGGIEILVSPDIFWPRSFEVEAHVVMRLESQDGGASFQVFRTVTEPTTRFGLGTDFGAGDTFWGSRYNQPLREFDFNGNLLQEFGDSLFPIRISPIRIDPSRGLLAGLQSHALLVFAFPLDRTQYNTPIAGRPFPTSRTNNENTGDLDFGGNNVLYALHTNNGLVAYRLLADLSGWLASAGVPVNQRGAQDDPAGDGVPNLLKFALGIPPFVSARDRLPVAAIQEQDGAHYLTMSVPRNPAAVGIILEAEVSSDLIEWEAGPAYTTVLVDTDHLIVFRDNVSLGDERRFMRLRVIQPHAH